MDGGGDVLVAGQGGGEGTAGDLDDLQGPHDPAGVGGLHALGGDRVEAGQLSVEGDGSLPLGALAQAAAHGRVGAGEVEVVGQGPHVQAGASGDDRQVAP